MPLSAVRRGAIRDIENACRRDLDSRTLRSAIVRAFAPAIPHHAYCFGSMDPRTLLISDEVSAGIPVDASGPAVRNEYLVADHLKFGWLARSGTAVGILSQVLGDDRERSPGTARYFP